MVARHHGPEIDGDEVALFQFLDEATPCGRAERGPEATMESKAGPEAPRLRIAVSRSKATSDSARPGRINSAVSPSASPFTLAPRLNFRISPESLQSLRPSTRPETGFKRTPLASFRICLKTPWVRVRLLEGERFHPGFSEFLYDSLNRGGMFGAAITGVHFFRRLRAIPEIRDENGASRRNQARAGRTGESGEIVDVPHVRHGESEKPSRRIAFLKARRRWFIMPPAELERLYVAIDRRL